MDILNGEFTAVGLEELNLSNPLLYLPMAGIAQIIVLLLLSNTLVPGVLFVQLPLVGNVLIISLVTASLSVLTFAITRITRSPPARITVYYDHQTRPNDSVLVSYTTARGRQRKNLGVKSVKAVPSMPLTRVEWKYAAPVQGTKSTLIVYFDNLQVSLNLGFPDVKEMNEAYQMLNTKGNSQGVN
jgi:hypothetical protein